MSLVASTFVLPKLFNDFSENFHDSSNICHSVKYLPILHCVINKSQSASKHTKNFDIFEVLRLNISKQYRSYAT